MQYPNKNLYDDSMDWIEFTTLLSGIMPETPLGQIVSIRSETDREVIKKFTTEQQRIRNDWINRQMKKEFESLTEQEKEEKVNELQELFKKAFS